MQCTIDLETTEAICGGETKHGKYGQERTKSFEDRIQVQSLRSHQANLLLIKFMPKLQGDHLRSPLVGEWGGLNHATDAHWGGEPGH